MKFREDFSGQPCRGRAIGVGDRHAGPKGRLGLKPSVEQWVERNLSPPVFLQPLTPAIALHSSSLVDFHGDPTDRMIVATALLLLQPLLTADRQILDWFAERPDGEGMCHAV